MKKFLALSEVKQSQNESKSKSKTRFVKSLGLVVCLGLMAFALVGCGGNKVDEPVVDPNAPTTEGTVDEGLVNSDEIATDNSNPTDTASGGADGSEVANKPVVNQPETPNVEPEKPSKPVVSKPKPEASKPEKPEKPATPKPTTPKPSKPDTSKPDAGEAVSLTSAQLLTKITDGVESFSAGMGDMTGEMIADSYGIDTKTLTDFAVKNAMINIKTTEIGVFKVKDTKDIAAVKSGIKKHIDAKIAGWMPGYVQDQIDNMENYSVKTSGNYVIYVVADDAEKTAVFDKLTATLK